MLVIICGLPGVGKTTIAKNLAPLIDASILSTDKIRKELISNPTYQKEERALIYDVMILLAKYLQQVGRNCILDATFNKEYSRNQVKNMLKVSEDQFFIVECTCPEKIVFSRLKNRKDDYSDADALVYQKMKKIYEPVKDKHITVDTSQDSEYNAKLIFKQITGG
jgi:predicted kinase